MTKRNRLRKRRSNFINAPKVVLICLLFIVLFQAGCDKHSFPKAKVISSVKQMCMDEYNLDVDVKVIGKTIGVCFEADDLIDTKKGFNEKAVEHLGNILLSVSRVCLSTDADFEFYVIIAKDRSMPGIEVLFIRHVYDVKRFLLGSVSRNDFFNRLLIDYRFNSLLLARGAVTKFFSSMSSGDFKKALSSYSSKNMPGFSISFFRVIFELKMKKDMHYKIEELKMKPIKDGATLVFCKVKETYSSKEGYEKSDFLFPSGTINDYLFLVESKQYSPKIQDVFPLFKKGDTGKLEKLPFPEEYKQYENVDNWPDKDFLVEEISFSDFIADQVAQRILRKVQETQKEHKEKKGKIQKQKSWRNNLGLLSDEKQEELDNESIKHDKTYHLDSVKANFIEKSGNGKNRLFKIDMKFKDFPKDEASLEKLKGLSMKVVKNVFNNYQYKNFSEVIISDTNTGKLLGSFDQKAVLEAK
ncbi:MAG: hypothetical protein P9M03_04730 [Candidatus Theseobacter exili]|nr:hypothetical protein [Candidatus Theseobacter exili]